MFVLYNIIVTLQRILMNISEKYYEIKLNINYYEM